MECKGKSNKLLSKKSIWVISEDFFLFAKKIFRCGPFFLKNSEQKRRDSAKTTEYRREDTGKQ